MAMQLARHMNLPIASTSTVQLLLGYRMELAGSRMRFHFSPSTFVFGHFPFRPVDRTILKDSLGYFISISRYCTFFKTTDEKSEK